MRREDAVLHLESWFHTRADEIVAQALASDRRVLLFGEPGTGKSTLAAALAQALGNTGRACSCIGADCGSPAFGVPGAVSLGAWRGEAWKVIEFEALCSLDAARFRLPLVSAVRRLASRAPKGTLLVDAPGVVRGVAGSELLLGVAEAAGIGFVLALAREGKALPLANELKALAAQVVVVRAAPEAYCPNKRQRARERTRLWNAYLSDAEERRIELGRVELLGTPPPVAVADAWPGRQIALLEGERTMTMGEVVALDGGAILARIPHGTGVGKLLLVRDARRSEKGLLHTAEPFASQALHYAPPPDLMPYPARDAGGPRPVVYLKSAIAILINGVLGDPLLHLRLQQERRSLLFDLGDAARLPAAIAHQVSDVFVSHAHIDHIGGFLWLLRARIGDYPACRLYGPPGLAQHIAGLTSGIHWDRVGKQGPQFEVTELDGSRLLRFHVQAGRPGCERLDECESPDGILRHEPTFCVRAATLDHAGIPVLAFAFESAMQVNIRSKRLSERGLAPGPWLTELKRCLAAGDGGAPIELPDGRVESVRELAEDLANITAGQKLVYATDLADTPENRRRLVKLAQGVHTLFCEASFAEADARQAARTGHLTARACGEIATAANVTQLLPFHFSRRYEKESDRIYEEVAAACSRAVVPSGLRE
jgi:ribonuclease Z